MAAMKRSGVSLFGFKYVVVGSILCAAVLTACILVVPVERGCTDSRALNHESSADVDDGSCTYSNVVFYASANRFDFIPITSVRVTVAESPIGILRIGTLRSYFPDGPGNCTTPGTLDYAFESGDPVDWHATVLLLGGESVIVSGTVEPSPDTLCIPVNVTSDRRLHR